MNSGDYVSFNAQLPASVVTQINAEVQGEMAFPFLQLTTTSTDGNTGGYSNFYPVITSYSIHYTKLYDSGLISPLI